MMDGNIISNEKTRYQLLKSYLLSISYKSVSFFPFFLFSSFIPLISSHLYNLLILWSLSILDNKLSGNNSVEESIGSKSLYFGRGRTLIILIYIQYNVTDYY